MMITTSVEEQDGDIDVCIRETSHHSFINGSKRKREREERGAA